jgi:hypothetical protein
MGLGIIFLTEVTELAQLRWFGHVVRIKDERCPKNRLASQNTGEETQRKDTWEEGIERILTERGTEWNGVTATARPLIETESSL